MIFDRLAAGASLSSLAGEPGFPGVATICRWLARREDFRSLYQLACRLRAEALADEAVAIADGCADRGLTAAGIAHAKLRINVRRHRAAVLAPRKFGRKAVRLTPRA